MRAHEENAGVSGRWCLRRLAFNDDLAAEYLRDVRCCPQWEDGSKKDPGGGENDSEWDPNEDEESGGWSWPLDKASVVKDHRKWPQLKLLDVVVVALRNWCMNMLLYMHEDLTLVLIIINTHLFQKKKINILEFYTN